MSREKEFLVKLRDLLKEYDASIDAHEGYYSEEVEHELYIGNNRFMLDRECNYEWFNFLIESLNE